jgi:peptidoglycan/LPS O-acetylase OafA/YrhL
VNVFFVISGYLITAHILGDADAGRFSVLDFYARRIRRILPGLFAMLLGTAAIGLGVLLPEDLADLGREVSAATAFASNVLYWRETGYFEAAAGQKLLLHTWSLAVEEQFYVVFPLVMYLVVRASVSRVPFIAAALALSFALAVWGIRHEPAATFYLAPTRAWELLLGALLAAGAFPAPTRQPVRDGLSLLGLALIGWSVLAFSPETRFPGPGALAPCLGAALVIHAGAGGRTSLAGAACGLAAGRVRRADLLLALPVALAPAGAGGVRRRARVDGGRGARRPCCCRPRSPPRRGASSSGRSASDASSPRARDCSLRRASPRGPRWAWGWPST